LVLMAQITLFQWEIRAANVLWHFVFCFFLESAQELRRKLEGRYLKIISVFACGTMGNNISRDI
jgi:hypothetical protein